MNRKEEWIERATRLAHRASIVSAARAFDAWDEFRAHLETLPQEPAPQPAADERAAFEASEPVQEHCGYGLFPERKHWMPEIDNYNSYAMGFMWKAWQARAALAVAPQPREWMPLQGTPFAVRMDALSEAQAQKNHNQSLARLKERQGLGIDEALALVEKRAWTRVEAKEAFAALAAVATESDAGHVTSEIRNAQTIGRDAARGGEHEDSASSRAGAAVVSSTRPASLSPHASGLETVATERQMAALYANVAAMWRDVAGHFQPGVTDEAKRLWDAAPLCRLADAERAIAIEAAMRVQCSEDSQRHLDRALAAEQDNKELRRHIERRASGTDPLANHLRERAEAAEAKLARAEEMLREAVYWIQFGDPIRARIAAYFAGGKR